MATQKFMGRGMLLERLSEQMRTQKNPPQDPRAAAIEVLQQRGHMASDGKTLTEAGARRDAMTAEERAKDRAVKRFGGSPKDFTYRSKTNTAQRKR